MIEFYAYAPDGRIVMTGWCPDDALPLQACTGCEIAPGAAVIDKTYRADDGVVLPITGAPSEHHIFDYTTKQWIDPRTLADFKSAQWATIKQARELVEFGGFVWDGSEFDSDAISQQRIQGLVHIANLDPAMSVQWTLADNTTRTLTSADAVQVGKELAAHVNEAHMKARVLREAIEAATTPEAVQAITWES
jgi:hypothetical protein